MATGAAVGLAAERFAIGRDRLRPDPDAHEPFGRLPGRRTTVVADDGVGLHVEVADSAAPVTMVFCHGFCNDMGVFHYQRRDLGDVARLVLWDQRSHGRSERGRPEQATIDQLGSDLAAVLAAVVPSGPIVLVGHSMGGMTILALADAHPELFGPAGRVVGVALLSTSTGRLAELTFGLPSVLSRVTRRTLPWLSRGASRQASLVERGRHVGSDLAYLLTRRYSFGDRNVSPSLVALVERMSAQTPIEVITAFYPTFVDHDKLVALDVLRGTETLVLVGDADLITPPSHSRAVADALPDADFVSLAGAGHMVQLERPAMVNLHLRALVRRALAAQRRGPDVAATAR